MRHGQGIQEWQQEELVEPVYDLGKSSVLKL